MTEFQDHSSTTLYQRSRAGALALLLILLSLLNLVGCEKSDDYSADVAVFCDSLDAVIRVVDEATFERKLAAYRDGRFESLAELRESWYRLVTDQAWSDSLRGYKQLPLDSSILRRVETLERRLRSDLANHEPQQSRIVDSLIWVWLADGANGSTGDRYSRAPLWRDSTKPPTKNSRRRFFGVTHPSGQLNREWLGRLARLRNQHSKEFGYSTALDLNLSVDELSLDWIMAQLAQADSAGSGSFQAVLDTLRGYYGIRDGVALEPADWNYYSLAGPLESDSVWRDLSRRDVLRRVSHNLTELGFALESLPIEIDTTLSISSSATPLVIEGDTKRVAVVVVGELKAPCNPFFCRDLGLALSRAVAYVSTDSRCSRLWVESFALLLSQLLFGGGDYIELLNVPPTNRGAVHRWFDHTSILEMRYRLAQIDFELALYTNPNRDLDLVYRDVHFSWTQMEPQNGAFQYAESFSAIRNGANGYRQLVALLAASQLYAHGFRSIGAFGGLNDWEQYLHLICQNDKSYRHWEQALLEVTGERLTNVYLLNALSQSASR